MSTMKFCRECNNILYPKEDREQKLLLYACRNCDHQEAADNNCVYRNEVHHTAGERTQVLQDVASDPTLPRTKDVRCSRCKPWRSSLLPGDSPRRGGDDVIFRVLQSELRLPLERLIPEEDIDFGNWSRFRCFFDLRIDNANILLLTCKYFNASVKRNTEVIASIVFFSHILQHIRYSIFRLSRVVHLPYLACSSSFKHRLLQLLHELFDSERIKEKAVSKCHR